MKVSEPIKLAFIISLLPFMLIAFMIKELFINVLILIFEEDKPSQKEARKGKG